MKILFVLYFVFLISLKSIFALQNKNISELYDNIFGSIISNNITSEEPKRIEECVNYINILDFNKSDIVGFSKCFLYFAKHDTKQTKQLLNELMEIFQYDFVQQYIMKDKKLGVIFRIFNNTMSNGQIDQMLDLLKNYTIISDSIIDLLNEYKSGKELNYTTIKIALSNIFGVDEFYYFLIELFYSSPNDLFDLLSAIFSNFPQISKVYELFVTNINKTDTLMLMLDLGVDVLTHSDNITYVFEAVFNFLQNYQFLIPVVEEILASPDMKYVYEHILIFDGLKNTIKEIIVEKKEYIHLFFKLFQNWEILEEVSILFTHIEDIDYLKENIPLFLKRITSLNSSYVDLLSNIFLDLATKVTKEEELFTDSTNAIIDLVKDFLERSGFNSSLNITSDCKDLFDYVFLNFTASTKDLLLLFVEKFFLDSSINKGDLLTYDNCLMLGEDFSKKNYSYIIYPSYIISFVNDPIKSRYYKNTSYFLKTNYIISICLPFGFKNETQKENNIPMCTDEDYNNVVKFLFDIVDDINNVTIKSFTLHENNIKASSIDKLYGIIGIIILLLPLIIAIFLSISKNIIIKRQKKQNLKNELIEEKNK